MERKPGVTWDDILGWAVAHPYISSAAVLFFVIGLLTYLAEQFPRFAPVVRVIGWIFVIIVGGLVLFFWIMPGIDEAIAARSRVENTASVIVVLLGLILWALWRVIEVLTQIRAALERNR